jgi:1-phosphofructokinase
MAATLGGAPTLCGFLGGETGPVVEHLLGEHGIEHRLVASSQPTGCYVADRRGPERTVLAQAYAAARTRHEVDELVSITLAAALDASSLVVGNPFPAEGFPAEAYAELVADARGNGVPVLVDLSSPRLDAALEGAPDLVKINDWELAEYVRGPVDGTRLADAAAQVRERGAGTVIITRGERPAVAFSADRALEVVAPVFDRGYREGCGDAMMGALAVALGSGATLEDALRLGAAAGAANFLRRGLGSATREVVEELAGQVVVRDYAG